MSSAAPARPGRDRAGGDEWRRGPTRPQGPRVPNRSAAAAAARRQRARRRRQLRAALITVTIALLAVAAGHLAGGDGGAARAAPTPVPAWRQAIVTAARSQVGYRTSPSGTYCNKYSAVWHTGSATCAPGLFDEPWCADFAAWAWRRAGVPFTYGYATDELNGASISFYTWGVRNHTWHPVGSGYRPVPGDVAVYGLDVPGGAATHVAVVVADPAGPSAPTVVNGDGDRTAFSAVELVAGQRDAATDGTHAVLAGYVAPLPPPRAPGHQG